MNRRTLLIVVAVLVTELCERLTYYSITGNLVLFFQGYLKLSDQTSVTLNLIFTGVVYFVPFFGGWVADAVSGRFNTIYGSFLLYFVGSLLMPTVAFNYSHYFGAHYSLTTEQMRIFFLIGLFLIAIGTGGIKANVSPFGAQQLEGEGRQAVQTFFNWFYWFINVGAGIAFSLVVYIQQDINFFYGYLIPACTIAVGLVIFLLPRRHYSYEQPGGRAFTDLFLITAEGVKRKRKSVHRYPSFLDYARVRNGGNYNDEAVDGLITIVRMMPIFACVIVFWTIYFQGQSTYVVQAERMNVQLGKLKLPVASLSLFNTIIILVATPVVDRIVLPLIERVRGHPLPMLVRIGFGLVLAAISAFIAGGIEVYRKNDIKAHGYINQTLPGANVTFNASNITVLFQIPQFMMIGLAEIFTSITGMEFAFSEAPDRLKGVVMGLFLCTSGAGSFLGSALVAIVGQATKSDNWMPDEINNGHFDRFCFLLGGIMIVNTIIYIPIAVWYSRKKRSLLTSTGLGFENSNTYGSIDTGESTAM